MRDRDLADSEQGRVVDGVRDDGVDLIGRGTVVADDRAGQHLELAGNDLLEQLHERRLAARADQRAVGSDGREQVGLRAHARPEKAGHVAEGRHVAHRSRTVPACSVASPGLPRDPVFETPVLAIRRILDGQNARPSFVRTSTRG